MWLTCLIFVACEDFVEDFIEDFLLRVHSRLFRLTSQNVAMSLYDIIPQVVDGKILRSTIISIVVDRFPPPLNGVHYAIPSHKN